MKSNFLFFLIVFSLSHAQERQRDPHLDKVLKQADSLISVKEYNQAIITYTEAIQLNINIAELYCKRGLTYMALSNYKKAAEDFTIVIDLGKHSIPLAYFHRGVCKLLLNDSYSSTGCYDLMNAKDLNYQANWEDFSSVCPNITN